MQSIASCFILTLKNVSRKRNESKQKPWRFVNDNDRIFIKTIIRFLENCYPFFQLKYCHQIWIQFFLKYQSFWVINNRKVKFKTSKSDLSYYNLFNFIWLKHKLYLNGNLNSLVLFNVDNEKILNCKKRFLGYIHICVYVCVYNKLHIVTYILDFWHTSVIPFYKSLNVWIGSERERKRETEGEKSFTQF